MIVNIKLKDNIAESMPTLTGFFNLLFSLNAYDTITPAITVTNIVVLIIDKCVLNDNDL